MGEVTTITGQWTKTPSVFMFLESNKLLIQCETKIFFLGLEKEESSLGVPYTWKITMCGVYECTQHLDAGIVACEGSRNKKSIRTMKCYMLLSQIFLSFFFNILYQSRWNLGTLCKKLKWGPEYIIFWNLELSFIFANHFVKYNKDSIFLLFG